MENKGIKFITGGVVLVIIIFAAILFFTTGKRSDDVDNPPVINNNPNDTERIDTRVINGWSIIDIEESDDSATKLQKKLYIEIARTISLDYNFRFDSGNVSKFTFRQLQDIFKMDLSFINDYANNCNLDNSYITFTKESDSITRDIVLSCESFK